MISSSSTYFTFLLFCFRSLLCSSRCCCSLLCQLLLLLLAAAMWLVAELLLSSAAIKIGNPKLDTFSAHHQQQQRAAAIFCTFALSQNANELQKHAHMHTYRCNYTHRPTWQNRSQVSTRHDTLLFARMRMRSRS